MTKITIFAAGSRGDIQPCLVLGKGLQRAGYHIHLAAPEDFAEFVQTHGVNFRPLRGDVQKIMASEAGQRFMESGHANPLRSMRAMRALLAPIIMDMASDAYSACADADALICLGVFSAFGDAIAESLKIPHLNIEPTPLLPTRAFPAPSWPVQNNWGGWHNYTSGVAMLWAVWMWYAPFIKAFRRKLALAPWSVGSFLRALKATPMLGAYSPNIIPRPADWPESAHITGYLFLDNEAHWQPPAALEAFLAAGAPPVYVGFGSMPSRNPEQLAKCILDALAKSGQRGLLLTGWGGLRTEATPDDILVVDAAPHGWLFPRMAVVVHHGGAGTTAEGVRAGVPNLVLPFILDQPFWGERIRALGLGPAPIPQKRLTSDRLANAIHAAVTAPEIKRRAATCGTAIRAENGLDNAVSLVQAYLGAP